MNLDFSLLVLRESVHTSDNPAFNTGFILKVVIFSVPVHVVELDASSNLRRVFVL